MPKKHVFTSPRLGFRAWESSDFEDLFLLVSDPKVMKFFPSVLSEKQAFGTLNKLKESFEKNGYTYFAVDLLNENKFIGFIGLYLQEFESAYTPCIDIGWRLLPQFWNQGFASEGAERCIQFAFEDLNISQLRAFCSLTNLPSERVMQKIGMEKIGTFMHPLLKDFKQIEECVVYEINKPLL